MTKEVMFFLLLSHLLQVVGSRHPHNTVKAVFQALSEVRQIFAFIALFLVLAEVSVSNLVVLSVENFYVLSVDSRSS